MEMYEIISKKRHGGQLDSLELSFWINGVVESSIPDYQSAALLMAICCNGMTDEETATLTRLMAESGEQLDLSPLGNATVDKHSSGGVGDKTTFLAAPIAAAAGATVAKMSGRGLGHTGGTIDKLESIKGFKTSISGEDFFSIAKKTGLVIAGQSGALAPADKQLYALRDVTATVDSIPLIAASILSKKLASGSKSIVLDVKVGSGAFLKQEEEAERLARTMIRIGKACGRNVTAVLSRMDDPLGYAVGNALEVIEAAELLKNPTSCELVTLSLTLASEMIASALECTPEVATERAKAALESGAAFEKLLQMVAAQGGNIDCLKNTALFPSAGAELTLCAETSGYISKIDSEAVGRCAVSLGAGRRVKEDTIDPAAGIRFYKKTGDAVTKGEPIATLYAKTRESCEQAAKDFLPAVLVGEKPTVPPVVIKVLR